MATLSALTKSSWRSFTWAEHQKTHSSATASKVVLTSGLAPLKSHFGFHIYHATRMSEFSPFLISLGKFLIAWYHQFEKRFVMVRGARRISPSFWRTSLQTCQAQTQFSDPLPRCEANPSREKCHCMQIYCRIFQNM
jgi:hypothetical protein